MFHRRYDWGLYNEVFARSSVSQIQRSNCGSGTGAGSGTRQRQVSENRENDEYEKKERITKLSKRTPIEKSVIREKVTRNATNWFGHERKYMTTGVCWSLTILK